MSQGGIETQVAIIGGGISGTAIARELSKYRVDTCLIEKEGSCGFGITKACQGLLHGGAAYMSSRVIKFHGGGDLKAFIRRPLGLKERWGNLGRVEYFGLAPVLGVELPMPGKLTLAKDKEDFEMIKILKEAADEQGMRGLVVLDRKALEEKEPMVHPSFRGALFDPNEAVLVPTAWAIAFAENAEQNGVHIYKNTKVKHIEERKGSYMIRTNNGSFEAEYVVNAAGLYADEIADMVGAADFAVSGWKVQLLVTENRDYIHHVIVRAPKPQRGRVIIPTPHNSILFCHTFSPMTYKEDRSTTKEGLEELMGYPREMLTGVSEKDIISSFASFLTFNTKNPDDHLLECPKRGFINAVISAPGMGPAPAMARDVTAMLADQGLELPTRTDFNPYLNKTPRLIDLPTVEKNARIQAEPRFGHIVCRCEHVSEQEIRAAVRAGAKTLDDIKYLTLAGFGRCQGGFCTSRVLEIMAEELNVSPLELTKKGAGSYILESRTKELREAI